MKSLIAELFKLLFKIPFAQRVYYRAYKSIFTPSKIFKGVKKRVKLKDGIIYELIISDWVQGNLYFVGKYEAAEIKFVKDNVTNGNVFIDIGANIGLYSLTASQSVKKSGKVIAFEPFLNNYKLFKNNIAFNGFTNIIVENQAISDSNKQITLFYNTKDDNLGMASSYLSEYTHSEMINAISLDQYVADHKIAAVDFVKIDIEGGEYIALIGMKNILSNCNPILLIEMDEGILSSTPYRKEDIIGYLNGFGYEMFYIDDHGKLSSIEVNKNRKNYIFIKKQ